MAILSLVIAGICSAGLSHGMVWVLTAVRAIDGPYLAYRHDATVAALLAAAAVGGIVGLIALGCAFTSDVRGGDAWFPALQRTINDIGPRRAFSLVAAVQISTITGLEAIEQVLQLGHTLGPSAALGAPLLAGIPIHAICALAVVSLLFWLARAIVRAESSIRGLLSSHIRRRPRSSPAFAALRPYRAADNIVRPALLSLKFANRPPPSIAA
jgi:hypothetical protein